MCNAAKYSKWFLFTSKVCMYKYEYCTRHPRECWKFENLGSLEKSNTFHKVNLVKLCPYVNKTAFRTLFTHISSTMRTKDTTQNCVDNMVQKHAKSSHHISYNDIILSAHSPHVCYFYKVDFTFSSNVCVMCHNKKVEHHFPCQSCSQMEENA